MDVDEFERRRADRKRTLNFLDCAVLGAGGEIVDRELGRTLNVSANGLLLDTPQFIDPGSPVRVTLTLGNEMIELSGKVTHVVPGLEERFNAGIEFVEIDVRGREMLHRYLASH